MKRVSLFLTSIHGGVSNPVRIEALTIDKICTPVEPVKVSVENYPHLKSLMLADSYPRGSVNVDVLIGADFYFSFMSGKCKKGETTNAPTAVAVSGERPRWPYETALWQILILFQVISFSF